MIYNTKLLRLILKNRYPLLSFCATRILASIFNECGIYFANLTFKLRFPQSLKLILIDLSYTTLQKYKLINIFLFNFTAYSISCLQKPTENYKSYDQTPNYTSFPRIPKTCDDVQTLPYRQGSLVI